MRLKRFLTIGAAAACLTAAAFSATAQNLVPNAGFEEGSSYPAGWERPDNIACFWDSSGVPGKCLVFDTRLSSEKRRELAAAAEKTKLGVLPKATRTGTDDYYNDYGTDSLSASERRKRQEEAQAKSHPAPKGVGAWSSLIPVKTGQWYLLDADVYAPAGAKPSVAIRGYRRLPMSEAAVGGKSWFFQVNGAGPWFQDAAYGTEQRGTVGLDYVQTFRYSVACEIPADAGKKWLHFRHPFMIPARPKDGGAAQDAGADAESTNTKLGERTKVTGIDLSADERKKKQEEAHPEYRTEYILLHPYAEAPAGIYRFDNIAVTPITDEAARKALRDLDQAPVKW